MAACKCPFEIVIARFNHASRRGVRWDLFETDDQGGLEIQRVDVLDVADLDGVEPFADDEAAAGFVVSMAQWIDNPNRVLRDECRAALAQLVESWPTNDETRSPRQ